MRWLNYRYTVPALALLLLAGWCWARPARIVADSMNPTLVDGDYVLMSTHAPWVRPSRGIVVAASLPQIRSTHIVKRIVALGGDTIAIENGRFYLNNKDVGAAPGVNVSQRKLPPGVMYLMGDHRGHSIDSRAIGPFPVDCLWGRPIIIYWSSGNSSGHWWKNVRWSRIGRPIR